VTGPGFHPYEGDVEVVEPNRPYLLLTDFWINDAEGNGDGVVNPGETVGMDITLFNAGSMEGVRTEGILSTENPRITILEDGAEFGDIPAGEARFSLPPPFRWRIDASSPGEIAPISPSFGAKKGDRAGPWS